MTDKPGGVSREAGVAGAGSGTALASLISLMGDGTLKSALLILAPSVAIVVAAGWSVLVPVLNDYLADWKIRRQLKRAQALLVELKKDPSADPKTVKSAEENVNALKLLELSLSQKRVQAVLDETGAEGA